MDKKELIAKSHALRPFTQIGSKGVNEGSVEKILLYLKKHKLGKIKILDSALDTKTKEEVVQEIVSQTRATLVSQVGKVVVLWKR